MKTYKVSYSRGDRTPTEVEGTVEELTKYFSYTLEVGYSWNKKINRHPKTIKSFISNINKSFAEREAACYTRTYVELIG